MAPSHVIITINCVPYVKTQTNTLVYTRMQDRKKRAKTRSTYAHVSISIHAHTKIK